MKIQQWRCLNERQVYSNPWISVSHHDVFTPAGSEGIYGVVHFKNTAVGVLPIDEQGNTWLVKQYRYPLGADSWEIPEGGCLLEGSESTQQAAHRELEEETGLRATRLRELLTLHLSNSVSDEKAVVYLAEGLQPGTLNPEDSEDIEVMKLPLSEAFAMALDGRITDAISVAALFKIALLRGLRVGSDVV
jgi:8-oxo-dGTP pyrophosphatase MutT (NUDIX family)